MRESGQNLKIFLLRRLKNFQPGVSMFQIRMVNRSLRTSRLSQGRAH